MTLADISGVIGPGGMSGLAILRLLITEMTELWTRFSDVKRVSGHQLGHSTIRYLPNSRVRQVGSIAFRQ